MNIRGMNIRGMSTQPLVSILNAALALSLAVPAAARAQDQAQSSRTPAQSHVLAPSRDSRVAMRDYVENQVINFSARPGFQSTIQFGDGERVENIAVGESGAWQVTPNRRANLLFVKPTSATAPVTNMTVVTDRHTYLFELRPGARATPVYLLRFAYAPDPLPPPPAIDEAQVIAAVQREELPVNDLNFAWTMKGTSRLYPERVFDDGHSVFLAWAQGRAVPAVLSIGPDGKTEGPVNFTADGEYLVVEGFHNQLVLRSGAEKALLETKRLAPAEQKAAVQAAAVPTAAIAKAR